MHGARVYRFGGPAFRPPYAGVIVLDKANGVT
jgi:hypothetical protein